MIHKVAIGCLQTDSSPTLTGFNSGTCPQFGKIKHEPYRQRAVEPKRGSWPGSPNGCPSGDPTEAPRCRAKTRRGSLCQAPAIGRDHLQDAYSLPGERGLSLASSAQSGLSQSTHRRLRRTLMDGIVRIGTSGVTPTLPPRLPGAFQPFRGTRSS